MFAKSTTRALLLGLALLAAPSIALAQGDPNAAEHAAETLDGERGGAAVSGEHGANVKTGEHKGHADPSKHFNYFDIGYKSKDVNGGKLGDGRLGNEPLHDGQSEQPMSAPFVLMLVNFGILLVLLAKFGGPPARKMAETRHDQIKGALDEAAALRRAAQDKLTEYTGKLASAQAEMDAMLASMRADVEAERLRIMANAEAQAAAVKRDAELRIAAEIQRARALLAREVSIAAAGAAEQILRERTTPADHTKLVDSFVTSMATASRRPGAV